MARFRERKNGWLNVGRTHLLATDRVPAQQGISEGGVVRYRGYSYPRGFSCGTSTGDKFCSAHIKGEPARYRRFRASLSVHSVVGVFSTSRHTAAANGIAHALCGAEQSHCLGRREACRRPFSPAIRARGTPRMQGLTTTATVSGEPTPLESRSRRVHPALGRVGPKTEQTGVPLFRAPGKPNSQPARMYAVRNFAMDVPFLRQ